MEPTDHNRRAWDEFHRRRPGPAATPPGLPPLVRERLTDLKGRHVLHLQCGTGEATAELADMGALVTAVDGSPQAIATAYARAPSAAFIHADVHALPLELRRGRFDLVYAGEGAIDLLQDPEAWATGITAALRPGGYVLLLDRHPALECLDDFLRWRGGYFREDGAHTLGAVLTALAQAGLTLRRLEEHAVPGGDPRVPGLVLLVAAKPASFGAGAERKGTPV
jgi:SAM-dependent methyltransferase